MYNSIVVRKLVFLRNLVYIIKRLIVELLIKFEEKITYRKFSEVQKLVSIE